MRERTPQALFLDRDGTLIRWVNYLCEPDQVELCSGVGTALKKAKDAGCLLFLHTNQSGVGRGYFGLAEVKAVNERMCELMGVDMSFFDGVCIATDHPDSTDPKSTFRKPSPRFELETLKQHSLDPSRCFFVGDSMSDLQTGLRAGMGSVLVRSEQAFTHAVPEGVLEYGSVAAFVDACF
jgi:D-glycero-D-manno-heptose 1,7-bisphosphate phosphatase